MLLPDLVEASDFRRPYRVVAREEVVLDPGYFLECSHDVDAAGQGVFSVREDDGGEDVKGPCYGRRGECWWEARGRQATNLATWPSA